MRQLEDQAIQGGYASQLLKVELAVNRASGSQVLKQVNSQLLFAAVREDPSLLQKSTVLGLLSSAFTRNRGSMGESGVVDPLIGAVKARPELLVQATVLSLLRSVFAEGLLRDSDTLFLDLFKAIENAPKLVYAEHFLDLLQHALRGCRGANSPSVVFKLLSEAVKKDPKLFGQSRVFETLADATKEASKTRSPSAAFSLLAEAVKKAPTLLEQSHIPDLLSTAAKKDASLLAGSDFLDIIEKLPARAQHSFLCTLLKGYDSKHRFCSELHEDSVNTLRELGRKHQDLVKAVRIQDRLSEALTEELKHLVSKLKEVERGGMTPSNIQGLREHLGKSLILASALDYVSLSACNELCTLFMDKE
jgi:hypothetical protein